MSPFMRILASVTAIALTGCSAAPMAPVERAHTPEAIPSNEPETEDMSPRAPASPELAETLWEMCTVVTDAVGDSSGAAFFRARRALLELRQSIHGPTFEAFNRGLPHSSLLRADYPSVLQLAEERGVEDFRCPALHAVLEMSHRLDRGDDRPGPAASASARSTVQDLDRLCAIAAEITAATGIHEAQLPSYFAAETVAQISSPDVVEAITGNYIVFAAREDRIEYMDINLNRIARSAGLDRWSCPAIHIVHRVYKTNS